MLVRAFEIQDFVGPAVAHPVDAREARKVFWIVQREGMGRARIEPDIEHVVDLFVICPGRSRAQGSARRRLPRTRRRRPLVRTRPRCARLTLVVDKDFLCVLIDEDRDRHAPGALARDHPIRAVGDHAGDAVFASRRIPFRDGDFAQRDLAQGMLSSALILRSVRSSVSKDAARRTSPFETALRAS